LINNFLGIGWTKSDLLDGVDDNFILSSNINANASIYNTFV